MPAVGIILAWAAAFVAGTLLLKLGGHTIEKLSEDVKESVEVVGSTVQEAGATVRTALDPKVLVLLIIGAALMMGVVKVRGR